MAVPGPGSVTCYHVSPCEVPAIVSQDDMSLLCSAAHLAVNTQSHKYEIVSVILNIEIFYFLMISAHNNLPPVRPPELRWCWCCLGVAASPPRTAATTSLTPPPTTSSTRPGRPRSLRAPWTASPCQQVRRRAPCVTGAETLVQEIHSGLQLQLYRF